MTCVMINLGISFYQSIAFPSLILVTTGGYVKTLRYVNHPKAESYSYHCCTNRARPNFPNIINSTENFLGNRVFSNIPLWNPTYSATASNHILQDILPFELEKRALGLVSTGFNPKHVISRNTQSIRRDRKSQSENDSGIIDPNLTMWRSINSEHKEVEQVPTDQTENIMNYYKDRWVQEHKEKKDVETISGTEVSREAGAAEKKSLYSQLARKAHTNNNHAMGKSFGHMGSMGHMGNMHLGPQPEDPSMIQYDPMKLQKTVPYGPLQDVENKERSQNSHRRSDSSGGFWSAQRSPYNVIPGGQPDSQSQQRLRETKQDPNGPYRPSFSMADLVGNQFNGSKTDKEGALNAEIKSNKRTTNHDATKEEANGESNSSCSFKPAPPPVPDFKPA